MIIKFFELNKIDFKKKKFFLFYGKNNGLIEETIKIFKNKISKKLFHYEENEILNNIDTFWESISNKEFFDDEKLIIISRASDKIFKIIEETVSKNLEDVSIILTSNNLEKKSKLRNFFEKNSETICVAFYEDTIQNLAIIANNFLKEKKINLSQENLNFVIEKTRGDRLSLKNELEKIELLSKTQKKIDYLHLVKITNLAENYDFSELINSSLSKNKKKIVRILNENNFAPEDCILILRIYLSKLKRLLALKNQLTHNKKIEEIINAYRPSIFWKEKEIVKEHIRIWSYYKILDLIIELNKVESLIKKNQNLAIISTTSFILDGAA